MALKSSPISAIDSVVFRSVTRKMRFAVIAGQ
jgi:hypothetical protein